MKISSDLQEIPDRTLLKVGKAALNPNRENLFEFSLQYVQMVLHIAGFKPGGTLTSVCTDTEREFRSPAAELLSNAPQTSFQKVSVKKEGIDKNVPTRTVHTIFYSHDEEFVRWRANREQSIEPLTPEEEIRVGLEYGYPREAVESYAHEENSLTNTQERILAQLMQENALNHPAKYYYLNQYKPAPTKNSVQTAVNRGWWFKNWANTLAENQYDLAWLKPVVDGKTPTDDSFKQYIEKIAFDGQHDDSLLNF